MALTVTSQAYSAVMGGVLCGIGSLALFRHNASFGGVGICALHLQATRGWRAGHILLAVDLCILAAALAVVSAEKALWSAVCAIALNMTVALNHRSDRYFGH